MKSDNALVSVIIPTYQRASVIMRAVKSVLGQTYKELELIIVNDGGSKEEGDSTLELLAAVCDSRLRIITTTNQGVSAARNLGVKQASGIFLAFLDSDDEWLPQKLEKQMELHRQCPEFEWSHTDEIWIRRGKRVNAGKIHQKSGGDIFIRSLDLCLVSPSTVIMKKDFFLSLGGFRQDFPACEDYDLWLKASVRAAIGFLPEALIIKYGGHADQLSAKFKAMDWWRALSLLWLLENLKLSDEKRVSVLKVLSYKCDILIKGYRKHGHENQCMEVEKIKGRAKALPH